MLSKYESSRRLSLISYKPWGWTKVHLYNIYQAYGFANSSGRNGHFVTTDFSPLMQGLAAGLSSVGTVHLL